MFIAMLVYHSVPVIVYIWISKLVDFHPQELDR